MIGLLIIVVGATIAYCLCLGVDGFCNWAKKRKDKKINEKLEEKFYSQEDFDPVGKQLEDYKKHKIQ